MQLNRDRRSSLKAGEYVAHFYSSTNSFKNDLILAIHQRVITGKIKINKNASGALDQDQTDGISCVSSSHATWQNLDNPSAIQWP